MIPKIIHYCWFGKNPLPPLVEKCIASWKLYCPDYEIICWNEERYDIHQCEFTEQAYQAGKWAFVADYVRLDVLVKYGGIYLDTDVELLKPIDYLLTEVCFAGFESRDTVATGVIGCEKGNPVIKSLLAQYEAATFMLDGKQIITTGPILFTRLLRTQGLRLTGRRQTVHECTVYPCSVFYPTGIPWIIGHFPAKTISVHHYSDSWRHQPLSQKRALKSRIRLSLVFLGRNVIGTSNMDALGSRFRGVFHRR